MNLELLEVLNADVVEASRRLLGAQLVLGDLRSKIIETEAYRAEDDPACHGFNGITPRNKVMFEGAGYAYIYFSYGCHWMLNITAHEVGRGAAVLLRAAIPVAGQETMGERRGRSVRTDRDLLSGPGKLCQAYGIDRRFNGTFLFDPAGELRLEAGTPVLSSLALPRVGIAQGKGHELLWRFVSAEDASWSSPPRPR